MSGVTRYRFDHYSGSWKPYKVKWEYPADVGKSVVDKTKFRPVTIQTMMSANGTQGVYDFPDGKDTGVRLDNYLHPRLDPVEIDANIQELRYEIDDGINKINVELAKQQVENAKQQVGAATTQQSQQGE